MEQTRKPRRFRLDLKAIFTKKHLVLASLILILAVAVYLNWVFTGTDTDLVDEAMTQSGELGTENYGDAQPVDVSVTASVYFEEARLNRTVARDQTLTELEDLMANADITGEDKTAAAAEAASIAMSIEAESRIENLVRAKGFTECLAYITGDACSIVVQTPGLLASEAAQIKDIILRETDVTVQNISIVEVN